MAVYLNLFHGRESVDEELETWGLDGPSLGPFDGIHTTYFDHIRPVIDGDSDGDFRFADGMLVWRGKFYGDWYVTSKPEKELEPLEETIAELRRSQTLGQGATKGSV